MLKPTAFWNTWRVEKVSPKRPKSFTKRRENWRWRPTGYQQYKDVALSTTPPDQGIKLLLEGAVRFARIGSEAVRKKDVPGANNAFLRAQEIITFLRVTLNPELGETAQRTDAVLAFIYDLLVQANVRKDLKPAEAAINILEGLLLDLQRLLEKRANLEKRSETSKGVEVTL